MRARRWLMVAAVAAFIAACDSETADTDTSADGVDADPTSTTSTTEADPPTTSGDVATTPPPTDGEPVTTTIGQGDPVAEAAAAFEVWVGHLGEGRPEAAWAGMAPTSRQAIGEQLFFDSIAFAMAEGWGSWSVAEDVSYALGEDEAGRTVLEVTGTVSPEGMTETVTVAIPIVEEGGQILMSPFEEFGNVAEGVREEVQGVEAPPVPDDSGEGRRIVYSNSDQRVWLVEDDGSVISSYLVSGKQGVPEPGTYEVFSKSETASAGHDDITMRYMVRFAQGVNLPIGFHSIPNDGSGQPLQSEEALGEYYSAGCVRQSLADAAFLYDWAPEGTTVVVLA